MGGSERHDCFPPVTSKREFARRFLANEFGNRPPSWSSVQELISSDYTDLVHLRNGAVAGGETHYSISPETAARLWQSKPCLSDWFCSAMVPDRVLQTLSIQGEIIVTEHGTCLYYSTIPKPMRDSLREGGKQVCGIVAVELLKYYLDPTDYDWLQVLTQRYDGHCIEFSHYNIPFGTIPNRRMVVWECRKNY